MEENEAIETAWQNELKELEGTVDLLSLVGIIVTVAEVKAWTAEQVQRAEAYAATVHCLASDNPGRMPDLPDFLAPFYKTQAYYTANVDRDGLAIIGAAKHIPNYETFMDGYAAGIEPNAAERLKELSPFGSEANTSFLDALIRLYNTLALKLTCQQCGGRGYTTSASNSRASKTPCVCTLEARAVLEQQAGTYRAAAIAYLSRHGIVSDRELDDAEIRLLIEMYLYGGDDDQST